MKNKLKFIRPKITLIILLLISCSKDNNSPSYGLNAIVNGENFSIKFNEMGYAKSNGSVQINAIKLEGKDGFQFFLGTEPKPGTHDLANSLISIVYSKDATKFINYQLKKGELIINKVSTEPIILNATFSGWAYKAINSSDSIQIKDGTINVAFQ